MIASLTEAKCRPDFEVRQLKSAPGGHVCVLWQYGLEQHIGGFASADEAQTWINKKSEGWLRNRTATSPPNNAQKRMKKEYRPMLATLVDQPFDSKDWVYETKWDGFRLVAEVGGTRCGSSLVMALR